MWTINKRRQLDTEIHPCYFWSPEYTDMTGWLEGESTEVPKEVKTANDFREWLLTQPK